MGVTCCNRTEENEFQETTNKVIHPVNTYVKDDIPSPYEINFDQEIEKPNYVPENSFHLRVYASYDECIFPIWVDVGTILSFYVVGSWYLFNGEKEISSEGLIEEKTEVNNFPIGCLLGHIQGGTFFGINNKIKYTSKYQGYLMLLQNNGSYETNPYGYLDVFVSGGKLYRYNEIEKLSGWNYNIIDTNHDAIYMKSKEKDLLILLNKLRSNPQKFAQKYLTHLAHVNNYYNQAYNYLLSIKENRFDTEFTNTFHEKSSISNSFQSSGILYSDYRLYKIAEKHGRDLDITGDVGHVSIEGMTLEERLVNSGIETSSFSEVCSFGKGCPIGILLQLLADEDDIDNSENRETLVNGLYSHVGISIQKHKTYGASCVITLVKK